jgi:hypothetical protein
MMKPSSPARSGESKAQQGADRTDSRNRQTPNTDLQDEDAGTAESGAGGRGTAAQSAMKQTSKTPSERGRQG